MKFLKCILGIKVKASFLSDTFSVRSIFSLTIICRERRETFGIRSKRHSLPFDELILESHYKIAIKAINFSRIHLGHVKVEGTESVYYKLQVFILIRPQISVKYNSAARKR